MLTTPQLEPFFPDLSDPRYASGLALVHSRFSTNTFPSWPLAHPFRYIAHNGEINTVKGNRNWMRARESQLATELFGDPEKLERIFPICTPRTPTPPPSTPPWNCCTWADARCRTRCS
jgi:glutamate synthase (NADPH/NADH) large chain